MATELQTVHVIADQSGLGARLSHRRMFGEFALYLDGKVVALVCDNQLFLKPTDAGRAVLCTPIMASAYPGSKPYFLLDEVLDSPDVLRAALEATAAALPLPKPKVPKIPSKAPTKVHAKRRGLS